MSNQQLEEDDLIEDIVKYKEEISRLENIIEQQNSQLEYKDLQITNVKQQISLKTTEIQNMERELSNKDLDIKSKENELNLMQNELNILENNKKQLVEANNEYKNKELIDNKYKELVEIKNHQLKRYKSPNENLGILKSRYAKLSDFDTKEYCIKCYKEKIRNNELEIEYLKNNDKLGKKLINPMAYILILSKSKPKEIMTNIKLYKALKNSDCFDIGYYMNNYPDIQKSNWCKYFSPELHYVCKGFNEKRKFNKKHYNNKNKMKLIEEIKNR